MEKQRVADGIIERRQEAGVIVFTLRLERCFEPTLTALAQHVGVLPGQTIGLHVGAIEANAIRTRSFHKLTQPIARHWLFDLANKQQPMALQCRQKTMLIRPRRLSSRFR